MRALRLPALLLPLLLSLLLSALLGVIWPVLAGLWFWLSGRQGDKHSELLQQLGAQLERNQVRLLDSSDAQSAIFVLDSDSLQRRTLSLFPNGQVAEYELIYKVNYQLVLPGQEPRPYQIELYRDYQDDPSRALAKSKELDLMLTELRQQAVARIIRQFGRL